MEEYVITDELRDNIIKWLNNIAEEADCLTTGNVSHKKADEIAQVLSNRFNQEGYEGWELVQWNIMPPAALLTASTTPCCGSIYILATFKKKLRV